MCSEEELTLHRAEVTPTLELHVEIPGGVPENVDRIVTENARTLGFRTADFEES